MASWHKALLKYALSYTGLLDDNAIDVNNLDLSFGRQSILELKNVGLNIARISKLAQLPPSLRVETARILSLKLKVPGDFIFRSSIEVEVDGIEVHAVLDEREEAEDKDFASRSRSPISWSTPQHRKVHQRLRSPAAYDPGGAHIPSAPEIANSFLQEQPIHRRKEIETSLAANDKKIQDSISSASSDGELGTGGPSGITGYLASYLEGIMDRMKVKIGNIVVDLDMSLPSERQHVNMLTWSLRVGSVELATLNGDAANADHANSRQVKVSGISFTLFTDQDVLIDRESPLTTSKTLTRRTFSNEQSSASSAPPIDMTSVRSSDGTSSRQANQQQQPLPPAMLASTATDYKDTEGQDAPEDRTQAVDEMEPDYDIKLGDDNLSWGSRRSKASEVGEELWKSIQSEDELPRSLLLDGSVLATQKSRSQSPEQPRQRRQVSPYERRNRNSASWPLAPDDTKPRQKLQSPESWPTMEDSQYSIDQIYDTQISTPNDELVDNKLTALQGTARDSASLAAEVPNDSSDAGADTNEPYTEDLTQSRMFQHDDARSIYMSAIAGSTLPRMTHPGAWSSDSTEFQALLSDEPPKDHVSRVLDSDFQQDSQPIEASGTLTPRARSPDPSPSLPADRRLASRLISLDYASIWIPKPSTETQISPPSPDETADSSRGQPSMPGTFSAYADLAASRRLGHASVYENHKEISRLQTQRSSPPPEPAVVVDVGSVRVQLDVPCCKLIYKTLTHVAEYREAEAQYLPQNTEAKRSPAEGNVSCSISVESIQLSFSESLARNHSSDSGSDVLLLTSERTTLHLTPGEKKIQLGTLDLLLNGHDMLHFDRESLIRSSSMLSDQSPDVKLILAQSFQFDQRAITRVSVETLPLVLMLDLQIINESLPAFGGLSGILEVGNSVMADDFESPSPTIDRSSKNVHFQDSPRRSTSPEIKLDCRIGSTDMILRGESCSIRLCTSSVKALYRESGIVASISHLALTGPHISQDQSDPTSISINVSNLRVENLPNPQNKDLETLLTLLTPSKDKYDNDDDILIDTLLRQRRKGAVTRLSIADVKVKVVDFYCLDTLASLGSEMAQFSAVAKYLPEDERPGPLTLLHVVSTEIQLPVNPEFGPLRIRLEDFELAHVGLPALLASAIGNFTAGPVGGNDIVHPLIQSTTNERLPMIMARMLGNEVDATIKLKLFNLCVEYSVPVILALSGLEKQAEPEALYKELSTSVAKLVEKTQGTSEELTSKGLNDPPQKKIEVILLVHDSAIGLTPAMLPSKALFILTDAEASTLLPPRAAMESKLELRKAAIFIVDIVDQEGQQTGRGSLNNTAVSQRLASALSKQGYSSVGSIGKAKISVRISEAIEDTTQSIELDFSNDFLLLETCADSTQTLIATLSGLAPPTPPDRQPKYKVEPGITIEQMMSSFTGEPVIKAQAAAETIFDADEDVEEDDPESLFLEPALTFEPDDLMAESEMTSSLYGPISGIADYSSDQGDADPDAREEDFGDAAESLLEDDPFEMPDVSTDLHMGDAALLRELKKQCKRPTSEQYVDLGLHEIDDLGLDALGSAGQPLGSRYRFNTPAARRPFPNQRAVKHQFPFKLRLRDVNAIWNIYDGFDWPKTRDSITNAVEQVEARTEERKARHRQSRDMREDEEPVIGDLLFNSFYIGVPSGNDAQELRRQINRGIDDQVSETELSAVSRPTTYSASGRAVRQRTQRRLKLERSRHHKIGFELKGVSADILVFPPDSKDVISSVDVRIKDFEIFDQVPTSTWSKFLTHMESNPAQREMAKPMFHIELINVRTLEEHSASEILLHVAVTPLRLHVDHDALDFITRFFEFKDDSLTNIDSPGEQPFLQRVDIETVDLRLDYKPKRIDYAGLRSGRTSEFMNFITLDAANIQLRHAIVYGLRGFDPLHKTLNDIWMPDVTKNQLPTVLAGLAPVRSLVNIGVSAKEVISIPIREYRKDGRVIRSIQKGAYHFGKTTTSELARFGAKVAIGTQNALQNVEEYLSPTAASSSTRPSIRRNPSSEPGWQGVDDDAEEGESRTISSYANQPLGALPGLAAARRYLEHDLLTARDAFIAVQGEVLESNSPAGVAAVVARHAPVVMLRPLIGASKAIGTTLLGVGNQIDRDNVKRMAAKYKSR